jgi:hypothetical protein
MMKHIGNVLRVSKIVIIVLILTIVTCVVVDTILMNLDNV